MAAPRRLALALLLPLGVACAERGTTTVDERDVPVRVSAALTGSAVHWLSVEVTGAGIATPLVVNLPASGTTASGAVTVPAGAARVFTARGYDVEGTLTHEGSTITDVAPVGTSVSVALLPVSGSSGAGSGYRVSLLAGDVTLAPGATHRLVATVTAADGTSLPGASVAWATMDPAVATVSRTGLLSAVAPGTTQVAALSGGGAAVVTVVVTN